MINKELIDQFRSFYFKNHYDDMEVLIEQFAVFGGLDIDIDGTRSVKELILVHILNDFKNIKEEIHSLVHEDPINIRLLHALAVGDRRIFSSFKRAGLNNSNGGKALDFLVSQGIVSLEYSRERHPKDINPDTKLKRELARHRISHKVLFNHPFVRFWFYFIQPHIKDISSGEFNNFFDYFDERQNQYTSLVFEELSELLLNYNLRDATILSSGSYWDMKLEIDILMETDNNKIYVGECKWTNHKITKNELHKLNDKCEKLGIEADQIVLFSKRGFSKELENIQGSELALYSVQDFEALLKRRET